MLRPIFLAATVLAASLLAATPLAASDSSAVAMPLVGNLPWLDATGHPVPFRDETTLLTFLREAPVVDRRRLDTGRNRPWKVTLEQDGVRLHAIFRTVDEHLVGPTRRSAASQRPSRDSHRFEVAAFALDRLLGFGRVPPTVERRIGTRNGSLQLWIEAAETEADRLRERREPADMGSMVRQRQLMRFFDLLVHNTDRNPGNVLIRLHPDDGAEEVLFIDHTRAFQPATRLVMEEGDLVMLDPGILQRLREVSPADLDAALAPYLDLRERDALARRRQQLLHWADEHIAARGASTVLIATLPESPASPGERAPIAP